MTDIIPDFGIEWPKAACHLITRHNYCAQTNRGKGSFYHRKELISMLWPNDYAWHRWNERRLRSVCDYSWVTWMGPGSSAKTTDAAVFALQYWLEAPYETAVIVCSTTMKMLRKRIWGQVAAYHQKLPKNIGHVGELLDSDTMIRWQKGDPKNGIFGMAVEEGPVEEVMNNLIGIHTTRVWLILDEMQGVRQAIMRATSNIAKNPVARMLGMGNPEGLDNPLGKASEPIGGWDSVIRGETEQWETNPGPMPGKGVCHFFDGRKSPADDSPAERKRLPWLINKDWIDQHLRSVGGNENDPSFWSQAIGWPPPMGLQSTVLDAAIISKFRCRDRAIWTHGFFKWASLDPSFEGKDKKILTFGRCGESEEDGHKRWVVGVDEQIELAVDGDSDTPLHYQLMEQARSECEKRHIGPGHFGLDSTGEGGGLENILDREWGQVIGIEFGGKPSDSIVSSSGKTADEAYDKRSTELNFTVREFAMSNGLRGLPAEAERQFCLRRTFFKNAKWCVEPKTAPQGKEKGFKQRMAFSPDHSDSLAIGVEVCRIHGAFPALENTVAPPQRDEEPMLIATKDEWSEENYLNPYEWQ